MSQASLQRVYGAGDPGRLCEVRLGPAHSANSLRVYEVVQFGDDLDHRSVRGRAPVCTGIICVVPGPISHEALIGRLCGVHVGGRSWWVAATAAATRLEQRRDRNDDGNHGEEEPPATG